MRINWQVFMGNSSTADAVCAVAAGDIKSYTGWLKACWPSECKKEVRRVRAGGLTFNDVKQRAVYFCNRRFLFWE